MADAISLILSVILFPSFLMAQGASKGSNFGRVLFEGAAVYAKPDFDSEVLAYLPLNKRYEISNRKFNEAFYRIRIDKKMTGFIADTDIRPESGSAKKSSSSKEDVQTPEARKNSNRNRSLEMTSYLGGQLALIQFREDTMGLKPTENRTYFGVKITGPDLLIEGPFVTEINFLFNSGAPKYYERATQNSAAGFSFFVDGRSQILNPISKDSATYLGFGPLIKYSKFDVRLGQGASSTSYQMQDLNLGLIINYGYAWRRGDLAFRGELFYIFEKMFYPGLSLTAQLPF